MMSVHSHGVPEGKGTHPGMLLVRTWLTTEYVVSLTYCGITSGLRRCSYAAGWKIIFKAKNVSLNH